MPIDRKNYHPKWSLISLLIRFRRAGNRCEKCGLRNYSVGYWNQGIWQEPTERPTPVAGFSSYRRAKAWRNGYNKRIGLEYHWATPRLSVVILTVSHLDHNTKNNKFWNLKALCQVCHLTHDRKDNAQKRMYGPTGRHYNQIRIEL